MRADPGRPRGEAARVAARVQALLREYQLDAGNDSPADVPWLAEPAEWEGAARSGSPPLGPVLDDPATPAWPWEPALRPRPLVPPASVDATAEGEPALRPHPLVPPADVDATAEGEPDPGFVARAASGGPRHRADGANPERPTPRPTWWQRIVGRVPVRLDPGRRSALAVGVAVLLAAAVTGVWLVSTRPRALPIAAPSSAASAGGAGGSSGPVGSSGRGGSTGAPSAGSFGAATAAPTSVVVDVAGKVRRPGLYRLPAGSRVDDAIRAAGGARPGVSLTGLNLAARLADGQQIAVGEPGVGSGGPASGVGSGAPSGPLDLNTASSEQLQTLPGVGPVTAQHILDYRAQHGAFGSVDQLRDVSGIGEVRYAQLRPLVTV